MTHRRHGPPVRFAERSIRRPDEDGAQMTETTEPAIISEALAVIDKGLAELLHRELVSTNEVADLLLDVRMLLAASEAAAVN
jgi:hypothetical protein